MECVGGNARGEQWVAILVVRVNPGPNCKHRGALHHCRIKNVVSRGIYIFLYFCTVRVHLDDVSISAIFAKIADICNFSLLHWNIPILNVWKKLQISAIFAKIADIDTSSKCTLIIDIAAI